jgi:hypothetical protein
MKASVRVLLCALAGSVAVLLAGALLPVLGGPALLGDDTARACATCWRELVRGEALRTRDRAAQSNLEDKRRVVLELADGKLTLAEAAERFRGFQARMDDGNDDLLGTYSAMPTGTDAVYRHVLTWVKTQLRDDPRRDAVVGRLEKELAGRGPTAQ